MQTLVLHLLFAKAKKVHSFIPRARSKNYAIKANNYVHLPRKTDILLIAVLYGGGFATTKNRPAFASRFFFGADSQIRTGDLILTKDALYLLSYISTSHLSDSKIILPHFFGKCNTKSFDFL